MSVFTVSRAVGWHRPAGGAATASSSSSTAARRLLLLGGCAASVAAAAALGEPAAYLAADPELARLLRGMALLKAGIVLAAVGALWWRFGRSLAGPAAASCLAGVWLMAGASMLVWQLSLIPVAAVAFHIGELSLLLAAWRDHRLQHPPRALAAAAGRPAAAIRGDA